MVSEDFVSFNIMRFLLKKGFHVVQYHPPGGQASFGLAVFGEIVYVDLIAFKDASILVSENKSKFNTADIEKLRRIISDKGAIKKIIEYVVNFCKNKVIKIPKNFKIVWAHGFSGKAHKPMQDITLICVDREGEVNIIQSVENQLVI